MNDYDFLGLPDACKVDKTIFKNMFYEVAGVSRADKKLFTDVIEKVTWLYNLRPDTINVLQYKDEEKDYSEIEVIEVTLKDEKRLDRIAEVIMMAIPYAMLLVFRKDDSYKFYTAHHVTSKADFSKNVLGNLIYSDWHTKDSELLKRLDFKNFRFSNYYDMYTDIVDAISVSNAQIITNSKHGMTGEEARDFVDRINTIDAEIEELKAEMKKETQFNRKMEFNIKIQNLVKEKKKIMEGKND